jgi:hypothetical protein
MENNDLTFAISDSFGNRIEFTSLTHFEKFVDEEEKIWQWVETEGSALANMKGRYVAYFATLRIWIQQFRNQEISEPQLISNVNGFYAPQNPPLVASDHAPGANVLLVRKAVGSDEAGLALAMLTGVAPPNFASFQHARIWAMLAMPSTIKSEFWVEGERRKLARCPRMPPRVQPIPLTIPPRAPRSAWVQQTA